MSIPQNVQTIATIARSFFQFSYPADDGANLRDGEAEFLKNYDPTKYGLTADSEVVTADACLFAITGEDLKVLLIKRGNHPYKGYWCLPGGFVDSTDVDAGKAAVRELAEETGVEVTTPPVYVGTFNRPWRDPRMKHITSTCYTLLVDSELAATGSDDADDAAWVNVHDIFDGKIRLGFDHALLVSEAIKKLF